LLLGLSTGDPPLGPPLTLAEIFRHTCLQSHHQTSPPLKIITSDVVVEAVDKVDVTVENFEHRKDIISEVLFLVKVLEEM
jgi:hypothetical protein